MTVGDLLMPWFYFDLQNGNRVHVDDIGSELDNIEQARKEAVSLISHFVRDNLVVDRSQHVVAFVRDGSNKVHFKATLNFVCERL